MPHVRTANPEDDIGCDIRGMVRDPFQAASRRALIQRSDANPVGHALTKGDQVRLLLPLAFAVPLQVTATVRWYRPSPPDSHISGLSFEGLGHDDRASLETYLSGVA